MNRSSAVTGRIGPIGPIILTLMLALAPLSPSHAKDSEQRETSGKPLFDGKSLEGWKITGFAGHGPVEVDPEFKGEPALILGMGAALTGITWTNEVPKTNYEISLEAMRVDGWDFFCGLTFPVEDAFCSLIVGGWGGGVVGISSIDSMDASENETTDYKAFEKERWYAIRLKVVPGKIEAWIDDERMVNLETEGRRLTIRFGEIELSQPLGIATWQTTAALRNIQIREIK
jgi:hypothetical protein